MMKKITIDNKQLSLRTTKNEILFNSKEFNKLFDKKLMNFIVENIEEDNFQQTRALKHLALRDVFTFSDFKKNYEKDGFIPTKFRDNQFRWSDDLRSFMLGSGFRGKKRPEHSKIMSKKMSEIANNRSDEHKENLEKFLKGNYFIKRAINLGLTKKSDEISVEEAKDLVAKFNSKYYKGKEHKISKIKNFVKSKKYKDEESFKQFVNKYKNNINGSNYKDAFTSMMSIISSVAMKNSKTMGKTGFFKTGTINVSYCLNKTIIYYRSSWELKTIEFLESQKIKYKYEPLFLEKSDGTLYLPDFIIPNYGGKKVLLEIKGFIRGQSGKENEKLKIEAAEKYCKENDMHFAYVEKPVEKLEDINQKLKKC